MNATLKPSMYTVTVFCTSAFDAPKSTAICGSAGVYASRAIWLSGIISSSTMMMRLAPRGDPVMVGPSASLTIVLNVPTPSRWPRRLCVAVGGSW